MSPTTQTAVGTPGKAEGLGAFSVPRPDGSNLAPDHVIVKVRVAGINNIDIFQAKMGVYIDNFPYVLGREWAGVVTAVGSNVKGLEYGDRVTGLGYMQPSAALQEFISIPAIYVAKVPKSLSLEDAVTIPHNFVASCMALFGSATGLKLPLHPSPEDAGKPVLIWGASSSTGSYAVQILNSFGYKNIYGVAGSSARSHLESIGVKVFDRNASPEELTKLIRDAEIHSAFVAQIDTAGWSVLLKGIKTNSRISYITIPYEGDFPSGVTAVRSLSLAIISDHTIGDSLVSEHLQTMLESGEIKPAKKVKVISDGPFLDRVQEAFRLMTSGHVHENIAVQVTE